MLDGSSYCFFSYVSPSDDFFFVGLTKTETVAKTAVFTPSLRACRVFSLPKSVALSATLLCDSLHLHAKSFMHCSWARIISLKEGVQKNSTLFREGIVSRTNLVDRFKI